jgi:hypothetical protein
MATITPTVDSNSNPKGIVVVTWASIGDSDTCTGVTTAQYNRKCFQVKGTFGSATVIAQGSNDAGTNYAALTDKGQTAIALTAAGIEEVGENPLMIRPSSSGGSGSSTTVVLVLSKD